MWSPSTAPGVSRAPRGATCARTTLNLLVKQAEMSSPIDAIVAISSALGNFLDILGMDLFFQFGSFPAGNLTITFAARVITDFAAALTSRASPKTQPAQNSDNRFE